MARLFCPNCGLRCKDDLYAQFGLWCPVCEQTIGWQSLTPSADLPACRDEDPATPAALAACYPPEHAQPGDDDDA